MITVDEARRLLMGSVPVLAPEVLPLAVASGRYLAKAVTAPHDHPLFDQSAVDGYCFGWAPGVAQWHLVGRTAAGDAPHARLAAGQCLRIFTGAALPAGADTVVMQEHVTLDGDHMTHTDQRLVQGANVRQQGEQLRAGAVVLPAGHRLEAAAVGLLRSVGVDRVALHRTPKVAVVVTGNEFCTPDAPEPGRIFSSNGDMLHAAFRAEGLETSVHNTPDDREALAKTLGEALESHDLVVTTGGVSVGEMDLVRPVLEEDLGVHILFHKVAQKPGKPMLLGRRQERLVLGLPGNPRAVLVLFWLYVLPVVRALQGAAMPTLRSERLPLAGSLTTKGGRTEFRAAMVRDGQVQLLRDEGSHMLASLVQAEALAEVPPMPGDLHPWSDILVHHLPGR